MKLKTFIKAFRPATDNVSLSEKAFSGLAALFAIGLTLAISKHFLGADDLPLIVASMGASAVLLFAVPQGQLSQPWPLVGGHMISGLIGVTCWRWLPDPTLAAALAVGLAIFVMYFTHCLHPPGGASALTAVVGSTDLHQLGYNFLLTPLLLNVVMMLLVALLINNLLPRRRYPNALRFATKVRSPTKLSNDQNESLYLSRKELRSILRDFNSFVDISEADLSRFYSLALNQARKKQMGSIVCREIMVREVIAADYDSDVEELWELMVRFNIRAIPVIDRNRKVLGIVTVADFLKQVQLGKNDSWRMKLEQFLKKTPGPTTDKPEYAGHIMSSPAVTVSEEQHVLDLLPLLHARGIHHIPVVNQEEKLTGIITMSCLIRVLQRDLFQGGSTAETRAESTTPYQPSQ